MMSSHWLWCDDAPHNAPSSDALWSRQMPHTRPSTRCTSGRLGVPSGCPLVTGRGQGVVPSTPTIGATQSGIAQRTPIMPEKSVGVSSELSTIVSGVRVSTPTMCRDPQTPFRVKFSTVSCRSLDHVPPPPSGPLPIAFGLQPFGPRVKQVSLTWGEIKALL